MLLTERLDIGCSQCTCIWTQPSWRSGCTGLSWDINKVVFLTNSQGQPYGVLRIWLIMIAPAYNTAEGSYYASSLCIWKVTAWQQMISMLRICRTWVELGCWWVATSVNSGSGLPGWGPGWNATRDPSPGQEPPRNINRTQAHGLLAQSEPDRGSILRFTHFWLQWSFWVLIILLYDQ